MKCAWIMTQRRSSVRVFGSWFRKFEIRLALALFLSEIFHMARTNAWKNSIILECDCCFTGNFVPRRCGSYLYSLFMAASNFHIEKVIPRSRITTTTAEGLGRLEDWRNIEQWSARGNLFKYLARCARSWVIELRPGCGSENSRWLFSWTDELSLEIPIYRYFAIDIVID